jgi:MFS family permease
LTFFSIVANTTSLRHRPIYGAITGGAECLSLAFSPLIAGIIAYYSTWRVSFYILIPIAVVVIITVFFAIGDLRRPENAHLSTSQKLKRLDLVGFAVSIPMTLCLVLAMQWAGTAYAWANWRIILLLVIAAALLPIFLAVEHRAGDKSMVPLAILRQRSVAFASVITFCNFGALSVLGSFVRYVPFL